MRVTLRPFQASLKQAILQEWGSGASWVLAVSPTGSGKTVLFSDIIMDEPGAVCAIAHRQELVSQISLALARNGVRHRIIGSDALRRACAALHMFELGFNYIDPNSRVAAAGIDTLLSKLKQGDTEILAWCNTVRLVVGDEAHHFLRENKWGKGCAMFPNARGAGFTATPTRADGYGLGSNNDGVFDKMVVGPGMRELINMGYLTDYRVFVPPSDLDLSDVPTTAGGDYSPVKLKKAVHRSHITGDVVAHYMRLAPGKLGVTFAVDIEEATAIAKAFRDAGVPAEVVSSKTPDLLRANILRRFKNRELLQLVNVDLFGEGFDLPAIEVVSMARPTQSFSLFVQQFGRALRLMLDPSYLSGWNNYTDAERKYFISISGKPTAIIIDHVGNVARHGLPDRRREWSLSRREKRSNSKPDEDVIPTTVCVECATAYERVYCACPYCGHHVEPAGRSAPQFVDGDLMELTADVLAKMRGDIAAVDSGFVPVPPHLRGTPAERAIQNRHAEKQFEQSGLRGTIALWAGWHKAQGRNDSEIYRLFYLAYGTDILSAQTLPTKEAVALREQLQAKLNAAGVIPA